MTPTFLSLQEVLDIHEDQIARHGGAAGVRDIGLLESAIGMPAAGFRDQYLHKDIFEMAAAYLFHIVKNHPFVDGNKRTGTVAADVFLIMNDVHVRADEGAFEALVVKVAEGKADKGRVAEFLREHSSS